MKNNYQLPIRKKTYSIFLCLALFHLGIFSQTTSNDSIKLDYNKIYSYCVQTNIKPALSLLDVDTNKLSKEDFDFKMQFENRFKYKEDIDIVEGKEPNSIDSLVNIFKIYWRSSLLDPDKDYDSLLREDLNLFFSHRYDTKNESFNLDSCITNFVTSEGYYSNGFGKVGRLRDLLVWKTQKDSTYTFSIKDEVISAPVVFLEDFVTKGWGNYATINQSIGGWATDDALYCVKESYDIESVWFTVHYLAHEGKHFSDYKIFPKLSGFDLEFRAKLAELSLARETVYPLIKRFIGSANYDDSDNQHPVANYFVIKGLSKKIFDSESVTDMTLWETIDVDIINNAAYALLKENTIALHNEGPEVENFIKKQSR